MFVSILKINFFIIIYSFSYNLLTHKQRIKKSEDYQLQIFMHDIKIQENMCKYCAKRVSYF